MGEENKPIGIGAEFFAGTLYIMPDNERFFMKDVYTGGVRPLTIPYREFFALHQLIKSVGLEGALKAAMYLTQVANELGLSGEQTQRLQNMLEAVNTYQGPDKEEDVLELTHTLLRRREVTHEEAADVASSLLGKRYSANAWRMKLSRWADKNGLTQVEQRKRRATQS